MPLPALPLVDFMSIEALEWVFKHSRSMGTPRTVLMVLAWHADSERGECWPGEALIAQESGLRRVRTVPDALRRLVELGEIQVIVNGGPVFKSGARAVRPNLYRIVGMSQGVTPTGDGMTPDARRDDVSRATGRRETRDGMTFRARRVDAKRGTG